MYQLAVFDIDGTLIDTERTSVLSLMQTVEELTGRKISQEYAREFYGIPSASASGMFGYHDAGAFEDRWEQNFIKLHHLVAPFPGVGQMLSRVKTAGLRTGLVTSRNRMEFDFDKHLAALLPSIDAHVCAEDAPFHKPHPAPLLECIRRVSESAGRTFAADECIYLGDTMSDFLCARDAGCDFALADWRLRGWQDIPAKYRFTCAEEIFEILGIEK